MATQALDANGNPTAIGLGCVDLTEFEPTALLPEDYDVMLIKTPDCTASATDTTPRAIVFKTSAEVTIPQSWRGGSISAVGLPRET
jgi:hypothetical protein